MIYIIQILLTFIPISYAEMISADTIFDSYAAPLFNSVQEGRDTSPLEKELLGRLKEGNEIIKTRYNELIEEYVIRYEIENRDIESFANAYTTPKQIERLMDIWALDREAVMRDMAITEIYYASEKNTLNNTLDALKAAYHEMKRVTLALIDIWDKQRVDWVNSDNKHTEYYE